MIKSLFFKVLLATFVLGASTVSWSAPATGTPLKLADYRGKVVVLDFWASWCVPCRRSFPWLNGMHRKYAGQGLVIIGVNVDREPDDAARFLQMYPAQFEIRYDSDGILAREYDVQGMPTSFVIGRDGRLSARHHGFKVKRQHEYEAAIVAALEQEKVE